MYISVTFLDYPHLSTCTNEPSGEKPLCYMNGWDQKCLKGMDLGVFNADWVSLGGKLHLIVVHCCSLLVTQSVIDSL